MEKVLFDAHTHLNEERYSEEEREELARKIEASPVRYIMDVGSSLEDSRRAVSDADRYDWCYASVGIHPEEIGDLTDSGIAELKDMLAHPKVMCVGEIGLDYHYDDIPKENQQDAFRKQIRLANELKMPIMIHSRDADLDTMTILKEEGAFSDERKSWFPKRSVALSQIMDDGLLDKFPRGSNDDGISESADSGGCIHQNSEVICNSDPSGSDIAIVPDARVLMHCYSYSAETAKEYVKLGATISICGPVTFKSNKKTRRVVKALPVALMTVETDAPYLAPEPMRGGPNMSPYVEYTCRKVAELKEMAYEDAARITCENAMRFYDIK